MESCWLTKALTTVKTTQFYQSTRSCQFQSDTMGKAEFQIDWWRDLLDSTKRDRPIGARKPTIAIHRGTFCQTMQSKRKVPLKGGNFLPSMQSNRISISMPSFNMVRRPQYYERTMEGTRGWLQTILVGHADILWTILNRQDVHQA